MAFKGKRAAVEQTKAEEAVMDRSTAASQLLLFSIKHTVSGLARPQEPRACVCVSGCVCAQDHKNLALWRAVKGAVNLQEEGAGWRPTHTETRLFRRRLASAGRPAGRLGEDTCHSLGARRACYNAFVFLDFRLVDVGLQLPGGVLVGQAAPFHQI